MTALEKAKDYQSLYERETKIRSDYVDHEYGGTIYTHAYVEWLEKRLAAIEAEKLTEDALKLANEIFDNAWDWAIYPCDIAKMFEQYAESYHQKKLEEIKAGTNEKLQ